MNAEHGASMSCEPYYGHDWQEGRFRIALHDDPYSDPRMYPVDTCSICGVIRVRPARGADTPATKEDANE